MTKANIYNLSELTALLNSSNGRTDYNELLSRIRFGFKDIEHLCFWDAEHHSKINVGSGKNYNLLLNCWENEQESLIHNHEEDKVFTYVIKGELTERTYQPINGNGKFNLEAEQVLTPRKISSHTHHKQHYHQLKNAYNGRSVSLHLYIKEQLIDC